MILVPIQAFSGEFTSPNPGDPLPSPWANDGTGTTVELVPAPAPPLASGDVCGRLVRSGDGDATAVVSFADPIDLTNRMAMFLFRMGAYWIEGNQRLAFEARDGAGDLLFDFAMGVSGEWETTSGGATGHAYSGNRTFYDVMVIAAFAPRGIFAFVNGVPVTMSSLFVSSSNLLGSVGFRMTTDSGVDSETGYFGNFFAGVQETAPDKLPRWATDPAALVTEPTEGMKTSGFVYPSYPVPDWFNWSMLKSYQWLLFLNSAFRFQHLDTGFHAPACIGESNLMTGAVTPRTLGAVAGSGLTGGNGAAIALAAQTTSVCLSAPFTTTAGETDILPFVVDGGDPKTWRDVENWDSSAHEYIATEAGKYIAYCYVMGGPATSPLTEWGAGLTLQKKPSAGTYSDYRFLDFQDFTSTQALGWALRGQCPVILAVGDALRFALTSTVVGYEATVNSYAMLMKVS